VAELLRKDLEQHPVRWNAQTLVVTASFGIAEITAADDTTNAIIARADGALYRAKQDGRNCVRTAKASIPYPVASHARSSIA
jgi:diguanylate cyclase (GGDEF)-like protein